MRMKLIAGCAFLLNTIFFATYYSVTKEALNRIDPIVFTFFEMISLAPAGLLIVLFSWKDMTRAVVKRGVLLGSTLCLALFTIAIALKYTTATSTAFFPALNGFVAALIAWMFFREPLRGRTWLAGLLSVGGAAILIFSSSMGNFRGTLIAFLGGLFYTGYIFLSDHEQKGERAQWPLFGIELLTTAAWANLVVLLFGDWQAVHPALPKDIWIIIYVSTACTFVPTLITVLLQKYISPVTVSFIYILEPVLGAVIATLYLGEVLSVQGYIGGGLVVLGALINTWGTIGRSPEQEARKRPARRGASNVRGSWVSALLYPALGCALGAFVLYHLGGAPPASWGQVAQAWPQFPQDFQQGQGTYVTLLLVQAGGWLVAWISVLLMGGLALWNVLRALSRPAQQRPAARPPTRQSAAQLARTAQPARHVRTTALLAEEPGSRRTARLPEQQAQRSRATTREQPRPRPRTTTRLPEQPMPRPNITRRLPEPPARRVRATESLPEHPTWYGQAVWEQVATANPGPDTPVPSTEPLRHDLLRSYPAHLYVEKLDA